MEPVVAAALINAPITLLVGTLTYLVGRSQAHTARQSALDTAQSAYQTALEAARRAPQREAYVELASHTHLYLAQTRRVLEIAEELDMAAEPAYGLDQDETSGLIVPVRESELIPEYTEKLTDLINKANDHALVVKAVAVVRLEGPAGRVTDAAERVDELAERLHKTLSDAGYWPEDEEEKPDPDRSAVAHADLEAAIAEFTEAARAHLNSHQPVPGA